MNQNNGHLSLKNDNNVNCKNVICTTKQMLILLLFDAKSNFLTFDDIYNTLNKINGITRKECIYNLRLMLDANTLKCIENDDNNNNELLFTII